MKVKLKKGTEPIIMKHNGTLYHFSDARQTDIPDDMLPRIEYAIEKQEVKTKTEKPKEVK